MKIHFIVDSTSDIPQSWLDRYPISVVPITIVYDQDHIGMDDESFDRAAFYDQLAHINPYPTTAVPPLALVKEIVEQSFSDCDHLVIVSVSSQLSTMHQAFRLASEHLPKDRVTLIDSQQLTIGIAWQVMIGAEVAAATGDIDQVIDTIQQIQQRVFICAALPTLKYLHRSGRVNWTTAQMGNLLQIRPIITLHKGGGKAIARVRRYKDALTKLMKLTHDQVPIDKITLLHTHNLDEVESLKNMLQDSFPNHQITTTCITPCLRNSHWSQIFRDRHLKKSH